MTEDWAGVDLALVLPGVAMVDVPDDQLPLAATEVLSDRQPGVLQRHAYRLVTTEKSDTIFPPFLNIKSFSNLPKMALLM